MTSSSKNIREGNPSWNKSIQRYKSYNPFCEPNLLSIIFLAYQRPSLTKKCLLSTVEHLPKNEEIEFVFVENGECEENYELFKLLNFERKTIIRSKNYGINHGLNQGISVSRGEFFMIHENDWECRDKFPLLEIKQIFNEYQEIGMIQLRAKLDTNKNYGFKNPMFSPWTCEDKVLRRANMQVDDKATSSGYVFNTCRFPNGFTNNPIVIRKSLYLKNGPYPEPEMGTDPRHGETYYQNLIGTSVATAHINRELYYHLG